MHKRTETRQGTQGVSAATAPLAALMEPLVAGMTATRRHWRDWVQAAGRVALDAVCREEAVALAGSKGKHAPARTHHQRGTTARELTFGGRCLSVPAPRVRSTAGRAAPAEIARLIRDLGSAPPVYQRRLDCFFSGGKRSMRASDSTENGLHGCTRFGRGYGPLLPSLALSDRSRKRGGGRLPECAQPCNPLGRAGQNPAPA